MPRAEAARQLPIVLQAQKITSQPDLQTVAEGQVEFRRAGLVIRAERITYDSPQDLARATGQVRVSRAGAVYTGPELQLQVQRFEGFFLQPEFEFRQLGAGGRAERIDFLDSARSRATRAEYTSCPRDGPAEPAWVLRTDSVRLDFDINEGVAEGAVLRFLGTPILALPTLSFPLSDARKSGWLPPTFSTDNRSGIELSMPYYWDIAPNRDATLTPRVITRRGLGLNSEFRYLSRTMEGAVQHEWLPNDRLAGRSREALMWAHEGKLAGDIRYSAKVVRVSDDDWWKDFPDVGRSLTARLLPLRLGMERPFGWAGGEGLIYARTLRWQVLQGSDSAVVSPYERSPQVGVRLGGQAAGWQYTLESEYNHFTLPSGEAARAGRLDGERWHALGSLSYPWREPGWWLVPRLSVNAASYSAAGRLFDPTGRASRVIPTASLDLGFEFERRTQAFGRALHQTLEPRLLYVHTPYRAQSQLPNYDAAAKDFNFVSIYTDNPFSGIDRVADAHQLTAGFTTRYVDASSGAEALRLGLVQRYLFSSQRVTAQADGTPDGEPLTQRFSDALLLASTSLLPRWTLDAAMQYSTDLQRSVRSVVGARYSPGPMRTVSTTYRLTRGLTEQLEVGWQWPLFGGAVPAQGGERAAAGAVAAGAGNCSRRTWYSVGRVNYSLKDARVTDSVLGLEYDAGCWIGRFVAERLSTGLSEATTKFMFQLELVGLSRIGSNPLQVLKDNIPGYRLLREERRSASPSDDRPSAAFYD
ncbi:LPS-assembly protein LptD [Brevundimonas sp.]|uniref:LPS-assembly protein LptD n=1 Tax=Brevundimonas sp. TaxID=1871086 RepID=UPI00272EF117|nr:LPS assembly protein LptD [Brevundimonas sp.]MDP1912257.1 LPS assembly protein LptD [Brevundimonas sp.]